MDDALRVRGFQCVRYLNSDYEYLFDSQRLSANAFFQGFAIKVFHHDKWPAVVLADIVDRANLRMIECRRSSRLVSKSFERERVSRPLFRQEFHRHEPPQSHVFRFVHYAHAAGSKLRKDLVMGNCLANHLAILTNACGLDNSNHLDFPCFSPLQPTFKMGYKD